MPRLKALPGGADAKESNNAEPTSPGPAPAPASVRTAAQVIGAFRVPHFYEVWGDGTYSVEEPPTDEADAAEIPALDRTPSSRRRARLRQVAPQPLWIQQLGRVMDTDEELVQLAFHDAYGEPRREWVSRVEVTDRRKLVGLSARGLPVRTGTARAVEEYLDRGLYSNARAGRLPCVLIGRRLGMHEVLDPASGEPRRGWLLGPTWIGPAGTQVTLDEGVGCVESRGYKLSGSEQAWMDKLKEVMGLGPVARWLVLSTFTAPLIRPLAMRTFIVHHWAETSSGKTALLKLSMSAWGDPRALTATFNRTLMSFAEVFAYIDDLPLAFDELQASTLDDLTPVIYVLSGERGRGRVRKLGGMAKEIESWHSVVRMTGEEPIIGNGRINLGGQTGRVLQVNASAISSKDAEGLHQWMEERHYGWGGLRFLQALMPALSVPGSEERLKARALAIRTELESALSGASAKTSALAATALASALARQILFGTDRSTAQAEAILDAIHVGEIMAEDADERVTVADRAMQIIRDHREANKKRWLDASTQTGKDILRTKSYQELFGVEHAGPAQDEVWLVGTEVNRLLRREGLPTSRVWADLRRDKRLKPAADGRSDAIRTAGKFRNRVYVIRQAAFDLAAEADG